MWVEDKRRSRRDESLFIFNFASDEEFDCFVEAQNSYIDRFLDINDEGIIKGFSNLIKTIQSRCDDKYSRSGVACSSFLFANEVSELLTYYTYLTISADTKINAMSTFLRENLEVSD